MKPQHETRTPGRSGQMLTRICIWSIRNHQWLIRQLRMYMFSAVAVLVLLALAGRLSLEAALQVAGFGSLTLILLLGGLIVSRRNHLLGITDPELRQEAYHAMLELIALKENQGHVLSSSKESHTRPDLDTCDES